MHKSKLSGFIIDCKTADLDSAAAFWGAALGMKTREHSAAEEGKYLHLNDVQHGLHIEVQKVEHASRVHLDIEADDIDAEVKRLTALGAREIERVRTWVVMEAPTGQRFCVVEPTSPDFAVKASTWR